MGKLVDFIARQADFSPQAPCVIIGEIGVNHNGDLDLAMRLIEEGARAGLDVLKFQCFTAAGVAARHAPSAAYQAAGGHGDGQFALLSQLEISNEALIKARDRCSELGVGFLCSVFDPASAAFVAEGLGCSSVKVSSSEIGNEPFLDLLARRFDGLILSSGASALSETAAAVETVRAAPAPGAAREVAMLHCVSEYPAPMVDLNLRAMVGLSAALGLPAGFSDHSEGIVAGIAAAALGARVLEKHYTLDKSLDGPDHKASADIPEITAYVRAVRDAEAALGDGAKRPAPSEAGNRTLIRKGLVCAAPEIPAGAVLTAEMLAAKRPLGPDAVAPGDAEKVLGLTMRRAKTYDEPILWSDFKA